MYPQIAKLIQDLLQGASISASRQNAANLGAVHHFLDRIQNGELEVRPANLEKRDGDEAPNPEAPK